MRILTILLLYFILLPTNTAYAEEPLTDPTLEQRAQGLFSQVRCKVCKATVIKESNSPFSVQTRTYIRQQLAQGKTEEEILDSLAQEHGMQIITKPKINNYTILLWALPWLMLAGGIYFVLAKTISKNGH